MIKVQEGAILTAEDFSIGDADLVSKYADILFQRKLIPEEIKEVMYKISEISSAEGRLSPEIATLLSFINDTRIKENIIKIITNTNKQK